MSSILFFTWFLLTDCCHFLIPTLFEYWRNIHFCFLILIFPCCKLQIIYGIELSLTDSREQHDILVTIACNARLCRKEGIILQGTADQLFRRNSVTYILKGCIQKTNIIPYDVFGVVERFILHGYADRVSRLSGLPTTT